MRARLLLGALVLSIAAAACGGDGGEDSSSATTAVDSPATDSSATDSSATDARGGDEGPGDVDCVAILDATQGLGVAVQLLAQLRTLEQYELIKDGTLNLDPAALLADIDILRALEGVDTPSSSVTVREALDTYQEAAELAQENLAVDDPFADAKGDELVVLTEDVGGFIGRQTAIGIALEGAGCS